MLFELWGATEPPRLLLPERPIGYLLLLAYALLFLLIFYQQRRQIWRLSRRQWALTGGLVLAALLLSRLLPISLLFESQLPLPGTARNPTTTFTPFGAFPFLLAGALLNPAAALVVGLASGLGRALWGSYQITDLFHFGLAAYLAALAMQQRYDSRLFTVLRQPYISGPLALTAVTALTVPAILIYTSPTIGNLVALDAAFSQAVVHLLPLALEGLLGGLLVMLIFTGIPQLKPAPRSLITPPHRRSLRLRAMTLFSAFAIALTILMTVVVITRSLSVATDLVIRQMEHDGLAAAVQIPDFRDHRTHLLVEYSQDPALLSSDRENQQATLRQIHRTGNYFRRVMLVTDSQTVAAVYPPEPEQTVEPSPLEGALIRVALADGQTQISYAHPSATEQFFLSIIVPIFDADGQPQAALLGQIPAVAVQDLARPLQGTLGRGTGFIVDDGGNIIAHPDPSRLLTSWTPPQADLRPLSTPQDDQTLGWVHESRSSETNARELVYHLPGAALSEQHPWTVVITVPYEVTLGIAFQIGGQLVVALFIALLLLGVSLVIMVQGITGPLSELVEATESIAGGRLTTTITVHGEDEVAQLSRSFRQMQQSLRQRLEELSLLLSVSQAVSTSMDLNQGMPVILQSALRGTGAAGVSVAVLNPNARQPLTFSEGPLASTMSGYDRRVMALLRRHETLVLRSPNQVQASLGLTEKDSFPIKALIAIPLYSNERFQGVFWLGYRQAHQFDQTELDLLQTLAGQISILVENSRLYVTAESGRRRLAAVLASTADAVIVTDPTEHILLINPAMEQAFDLNTTAVVGRKVKDVITDKRLVDILSSKNDRIRHLELNTRQGRTLYASASTVANNQGQAMGRVAVLHDITMLKEVDKMKSDFVSTVSHDLRSPLTYMRGYATMLPDAGALNEKQREYVDKILSGIDQMSTLVKDLLDIGRLEAGVELALSKFPVRSMLAGVVDEMRHPAQEKGLALSLAAASDLPLVEGDQTLIRQAVRNLVSNTMKYAPNSGEVIVSAVLEGNEIVISVQDQGPGIARRDQVRLFEKFYRVKDRHNTAVKGTGLGLSIVRTIAERHGGRAWCQSEPGKGSTFSFSLPINQV
jgi:PAS domain S-box-containing protein